MKRHWLLVLALLLVVALVGAERYTAGRKAAVVHQRTAVRAQVQEANFRSINIGREKADYQTIGDMGRQVVGQVKWETDPARLLQWFSDTAAQSGVRMTNSRIGPPDAAGALVASGSFGRVRFELAVSGGFRPLVEFIERIERAPQPMVIETLQLIAERDNVDSAQLRMAVSCLYPAVNPASADKGAKP